MPGFGIEDLVSVANGLLSDHPDQQISRRTVRFYVAEGLIPAPVGSPKFARYPYAALVTVVGLRKLQADGWSLPLAAREVQERLSSGTEDDLLGMITGAVVEVREQRSSRQAPVPERLTRFRFGIVTVEIPDSVDPEDALERLAEDLRIYLTP